METMRALASYGRWANRTVFGLCREVDPARLLALAPDLDLPLVERHLASFLAICEGGSAGGPLADLPAAERFHWLTAPRSTIIQTSPAHVGRTLDPPAELDRLLDAYVRPPRTVP